MLRHRSWSMDAARLLTFTACLLLAVVAPAHAQRSSKASADPDENRLALKKHIHSLAFSPDEQTLAVGTSDVLLIDMSVDPPAQKGVLPINQFFGVHSLDYSPDGQFLAIACPDHSVRIWEMGQTPREVGLGKSHAQQVRAVAFSPDGRYVASGSDDRTVILWSISESGELSEKAVIRGPDTNNSPLRAVGFNDKTGRRLVTLNSMGVVRFLDISGKAPRQLSTFRVKVFGDVTMALGAGGKRLAVNETKDILIYGSKAPLQGHKETVSGLAYSPDGQSLASCGRDGRLIVWNTSSMKPRFTRDRPERFTCVAYPPPPQKGKPSATATLAAGTENGQLYIIRHDQKSKK